MQTAVFTEGKKTDVSVDDYSNGHPGAVVRFQMWGFGNPTVTIHAASFDEILQIGLAVVQAAKARISEKPAEPLFTPDQEAEMHATCDLASSTI